MAQDPLSLVRQATMTKTPVSYVDNHYIFGPYRFHETTKTCFKRTLGRSTADYFYTLKDVIFFLENAELSIAEYRRKIVHRKDIIAVVVEDTENLKNYLTGVIETCPQLDYTAAALSSSAAAGGSIDTSAASKEAPDISIEQLKEQRERHAALLDQSLLGTSQSITAADVPGLSHEKLEELRALRRQQKRKSVVSEGGLEGLDPAFIQADRQLLAILRSDETPSQTRSSVLCKSGADFSFALKLFNDRVLKKIAKGPEPAQKPSAPPGSSSGAQRPSSGEPPAKRPRDDPRAGAAAASAASGGAATAPVVSQRGPPIIVVPSAMSSVISSINAADLLEKGTYVSVEEKRQSGAKREQEVLISRKLPNGQTVQFLITDNASKNKLSTPADWERVVAVFATGQAWQFKDWLYSNPVDLFQRVVGVHLTMDNRAVEPTILNWNCKVLKINSSKRHLDAGAVNEFWAAVDDYVRLRKPWIYQPRSGSSGGAAAGAGNGQRPAHRSSSGGTSAQRPSSSSQGSHRPSSSSQHDGSGSGGAPLPAPPISSAVKA